MLWHESVQEETPTERVRINVGRAALQLLIVIFLAWLPVACVGAKTAEVPSSEPTVEHQAKVFERLWRVYPNKTDRLGAIAAWNNLKVSDDELYQMRLAYPRWRASEEWQKEQGKHVPPLAAWLGDRMWEKAPPPEAPLRGEEVSSFLFQPLYLAPRVAFAVTGTLIGGAMFPFDKAAAESVWDTSFNAPWVWHKFLMEE